MPAAATAMPPKPKTAAMMAITKKTQAYHSIYFVNLPEGYVQAICLWVWPHNVPLQGT